MKSFLSRALFRSTVLIATIASSGCNESVTGNTGDRLTVAEVNFLVNTIVLSFGAGLVLGGEEFGGEIDQLFDCNAGGGYGKTGTYAGSEDPVTGNRQVSIEYVVDYFNCDYELGEVVMRLNRDPGVRVSVDATDIDGTATYEFELKGGIRFETPDEREGRCAMNLTVELSIDLEGDDDTVVVFGGSACGISGSELTLNVA